MWTKENKRKEEKRENDTTTLGGKKSLKIKILKKREECLVFYCNVKPSEANTYTYYIHVMLIVGGFFEP